MTLAAAGKKLPHLGLCITSQHQLVGSTSAAGTGLPLDISPNSADSSLLFLHGCPPSGYRCSGSPSHEGMLADVSDILKYRRGRSSLTKGGAFGGGKKSSLFMNHRIVGCGIAKVGGGGPLGGAETLDCPGWAGRNSHPPPAFN